MAKRTFLVEFEAYVTIDDSVIGRGLSAEYAAAMYEHRDADEVAEHLAYNLAINNIRLSQIDGFSDMDDQLADLGEITVSAREVE